MSKRLLHLLTFLFLAGLLLAGVGRAAAQTAQLIVDPADSPLIVAGRLSDATQSFNGVVRLTYTGEGTVSVALASSRLRSGDPLNSQATVALDGSPVLTGNRPADVSMIVSNASRPGTYSGEIRLTVVGQEIGVTIPVEARIGVTPDVKPLADALPIATIRCAAGLDCWLASQLVPTNVQRDRWPVQLENDTLLDAKVTGATVVVSSPTFVVTDELHLAEPITIGPKDVAPAMLIVDRDRLPAGSYSGSLRFRVEGADEPVIQQMTMTVRSGPLMPLLVIVLGILVGRLARGMETPQAQAQQKLRVRINKLEKDAAALKDPGAIAFMQAQIADLRRRNNDLEPEATLDASIVDLTNRLPRLLRLDEIEVEMKSETFKNLALSRDVLALVPVQRALWQNMSTPIADAQAGLDKINTMITDALKEESVRSSRSLARRLNKLIGPMVTSVSDQVAKAGAEVVARAPTFIAQVRGAIGQVGAAIRQAAEVISGIPANADVRFYLVRPFLWLLALFFFAVLGLQNQYVNANPSFGAGGIYDLIGLFLWGVTADIGSTAILQIPDSLRNNG